MPYDLNRLDLLIVEPDTGVASTWRRLLSTLRMKAPNVLPDTDQAWTLLKGAPQGGAVTGTKVDALICRWELPGDDGLKLIERLRRDAESPAPFLPAIIVTTTVTRERVRQALDAGVHEVLMLPLTPKAVESRLREMVERPRKFVRGGGYFGPDRRRQVRADYAGPFRRAADRAKT
ncbi:response regulator [Ferrovibrio terrae]|uniref:response regulator n=1 Tax=Ferrovibrio terrae TaxID=2594003 RepID=UPI0031383970